MRYRALGKTGLTVSEIGFGGWGIGGKWWGGPQDDLAIQALKRAVDLGINFFDTAMGYGNGHSERLIGKVLKDLKSGAAVATKVPPKDRKWPPTDPNVRHAFPIKYVSDCVDQSLKCLGLERVDLLQFHVWHDPWTDQDEWREVKERLVQQGKIRFFGVSVIDHAPDSAVRLVETGEADSVQVIYNIFDQSPEEKLFPACVKHGVGVIARVPLDEGGLTGTLTEKTVFPEGDFRSEYFGGNRLRETIDRANRLAFLVRDEIRSLAQGALKFVLSHPAVSTTIPGMRRPAHVDSNAAVSDGLPLRSDELARLKDHAWPRNFYGD